MRTIQNAEASGQVILQTLVKIANALGVQPKDLIAGSSRAVETSKVSGRGAVSGGNRHGALAAWPDLQVRRIWTFDEADDVIDGEEAVRAAFHEMWWPESNRGWKSSISKGAYRLENEHAKRDDRRWIDFSPKDGHLSRAPVSVEVSVEQDTPSFGSGAGLLYRFQEGRTRFYSFILTGDGQVRFAIRGKDDERTLFKSGSPVLLAGRFTKLGIMSQGTEFRLFVNDTLIKAVRNDELRSGGLGIVASGAGRFAFRNLTIYADL